MGDKKALVSPVVYFTSKEYHRHMRKITGSVLVLTILLTVFGSAAIAFAQSASRVDPLAHIFAHPDFILETTHGTQAPNNSAYTPQQLTKAYAINQISKKDGGKGVTVAIDDACGNSHAQADLNAYDKAFGLKSTTIKVVQPEGTPCSDPGGWGVETDLDIQMVHDFAPKAKIVLEEAKSSSFSDLINAAKDAYTNQGATIVSMSFGGNEFSSETGASADGVFSAGNAKGVSFTASSGDSGCGSQYPAASPFVTSVGGTVLTTKPDGTYISETAWNGSGGGTSIFESRPSYQNGFNSNSKRGIPDVAMVSTNVTMYDSDLGGFITVGGTSIAAPLWAGVLARANQLRSHSMQNADNELYSVAGNSGKYASDFHDITTGGSGGICSAKTGYDYVTGLGTEVGNALVPDLIAAP
jgi:subtilase family serine protease